MALGKLCPVHTTRIGFPIIQIKTNVWSFHTEAVVATKIGFKLKPFAKISAKIKLSSFE